MFYSSLAWTYLYVGGIVLTLCGTFDYYVTSRYPRIQYGPRKRPELWIVEALETARSMYDVFTSSHRRPVNQ
jgi:hypothetical protein